jgi:hypothetical protein
MKIQLLPSSAPSAGTAARDMRSGSADDRAAASKRISRSNREATYTCQQELLRSSGPLRQHAHDPFIQSPEIDGDVVRSTVASPAP